MSSSLCWKQRFTRTEGDVERIVVLKHDSHVRYVSTEHGLKKLNIFPQIIRKIFLLRHHWPNRLKIGHHNDGYCNLHLGYSTFKRSSYVQFVFLFKVCLIMSINASLIFELRMNTVVTAKSSSSYKRKALNFNINLMTQGGIAIILNFQNRFMVQNNQGQ